MTIERRADLVLPAVLGDLAGNTSPDYLDDVLAATAQVRQLRASASIQRWLPILDTTGTSVLGPRVPWRALAVALVIIAVLVASLALLAGAASRKLAPPFGLAETGLVAFVSGDDLVATMPDGTDRRTLVTGEGVQWGLIWSHRGDRFAYWSATRATLDLPSTLWVADRDGSNQQVVSGDPVPGVADLLPNASWSPDDRRLVFGDGGVLYVVNADGSDLHSIGAPTHQRATPVWSPDGSLIAYTGQPLADPSSQTSTWVITPDGLTDVEVIPAQGGFEIANVNPSWSNDGRSLLVHTGGATVDGPPTDIKIARRDAAGRWSYEMLVGGSTWNYLPAWSTTNTRFAFLRPVGGSDSEAYVVMVADADGSHVRQVSDRQVTFATPCWSPDDRFIRAEGAETGGNRTVVLLPLDGSPPVDIPALGGSSAGCYMQRRAP